MLYVIQVNTKFNHVVRYSSKYKVNECLQIVGKQGDSLTKNYTVS